MSSKPSKKYQRLDQHTDFNEEDSNSSSANPFQDDAEIGDLELDGRNRAHAGDSEQRSGYTTRSDSFDDIVIDIDSISNEHERKSNLKSAFFNMSNSIIGAGVIGMPRAFKNSGLLTGIVLLMVLTFLNDWTLRLIIINTKLSGERTYTGFVNHSFGDLGKIVVLLAQGFFGFGGNIGFSVIIGDSIPHVLRSIFKDAILNHKSVDFLLSRNVLICVCIMGISYPLSLTRDISKLSRASGLALVSMSIILLIVVFRGPLISSDLKGNISGSAWFINSNIFQSISVISFALVCHHNTTFIYDSLRHPTLDRFNKVTHYACVISGAVCGVMAVCGYLTFGSKTKGNILNNFPSDDWVANIARFCFGLNMLTTFPLEIFVVRAVVKDLIVIFKRRQPGNEDYEQDVLTNRQHLITTTVLTVLPMTVALFTCNLGAILELVGATSASLLAYILPPMCLLKVTWSSKTTLQKIPSFMCIAFGFSVMFLSSTQTIISAIRNSDNDGHCVE
ncbi:hypothetical protein CANARDRAFT_6132 [[Candida] arabinofermentans NRRL YB-2248]|uniref:Amino acid transporter transmembrane domain-containing protein n=1 Tax=[Candida] arabinofermentans NRRL YB-2248 TaxID=983967 RepID=A0A1E4T770_9ASCO|nr:hypothetical protein CANARDRAFT_6132 [[Candida] arabinofermentans NRRL YB-2248]